jgi:hypothetical protein
VRRADRQTYHFHVPIVWKSRNLNLLKPKGPIQACIGSKVKGKVVPRTGHEGTEGEYRYSTTLSLTSALHGGGWLTLRPGRFTHGMTRYPLYRRLGRPQGRSGRVLKISSPPGSNPRTVQLVPSRYLGPPCIGSALPLPHRDYPQSCNC